MDFQLALQRYQFPQPNGCGLIEGTVELFITFALWYFRSLTVAASLKELLCVRRICHAM